MTFNRRQLAAIITGCWLLAPPPAAAAEDKPMERTITVSASGSVTAEPDQARINTGVVSEASTAIEALNKNTDAMKKVVAELKAKGVDAKDIQTSSFNVEPVVVYTKEGAPPKVTGYRVNNEVAVMVRDLAKLGSVLDQLVSVGANQVHGLSFDVSKAETLKDEARKEAMANALRRAKLLAAAGGAEVGEIVQIAEDVTFGGPQPVTFSKRAMAAEAVPIERGSQQLESRVTVTWRLK